MSKVDNGIVNIHGKQYQTVALRVSMFREKHPLWSLITTIIHRDGQCVVMLAAIADEAGRVLATGTAEEYRETSQINRTSALENAETSAIGRALATMGYGGTEFATADEVANAIARKPQAPIINPVKAALECEPEIDPEKVQRVASALADFHLASTQSDDAAEYRAYELVESLDDGMKLAVWLELKDKSRVRSWLKKIAESRRIANANH